MPNNFPTAPTQIACSSGLASVRATRYPGPMPVDPGIGQRLKELRTDIGLNQVTVCERVGLSRSYLSMLEAGHFKPSRRTLAMLAEFYGVSTHYLETGEDAGAPPVRSQVVDDPGELALLGAWRRLRAETQARLLDALDMLARAQGRETNKI